MALKKRGKYWHLRIRPFGKQVWVSTGSDLKSRAENIERQILVACGSQDYRSLDPEAQEYLPRDVQESRMANPSDLAGEHPRQR